MSRQKFRNSPSGGRRFLATYQQSGNIVWARAAGIRRQQHYRWLNSDPEYACRFDESRRGRTSSNQAMPGIVVRRNLYCTTVRRSGPRDRSLPVPPQVQRRAADLPAEGQDAGNYRDSFVPQGMMTA
jgi:hypothetical protein